MITPGKLLFLLLLCTVTLHSAETNDPSAGFRFKQVNENSLALWENDKPVLVYNYGAISNSTVRGSQPRSCYVHPLYGLDGEVLTDDFPRDHDYHRGLYWAWPHIKIGQQEYDLWTVRGIEQKFQRWLTRETTAGHAILSVENGWFVGGRKVMQEFVTLRVHPSTAESRAIDLELAWTPLNDPITLSGAPEKSYGGLNLRFGPRTKTIITVPMGRAADDLVVTKLPWADLSGNFARGDELSGAAIFVNRDHPDYPPTWMARHYGLLSVGWPGVTAQTFPPGKRFSCRYRIWIHRQLLQSDAIEKAYRQYLQE